MIGSGREVKRVVIVGAGFAGLNAARGLGGRREVTVTVIDRQNHHLFQPLLYQVAMAGLSPADIAAPIRSLLASHDNVRVLQGEVCSIDLEKRRVRWTHGELPYDFLLVATGSQHTYFGHCEWEPLAPGLKTLAQATEIRRRVLEAFERAECEPDEVERARLLEFVIVGGGPTGVEIAGAIAELARFTLSRDFRHIDPSGAHVHLLEGGPRLLPGFSERSASAAARDLARLGVTVATGSLVDEIDEAGVRAGGRRITAATVIWAAGVRASPLAKKLGVELDEAGRVPVERDCSLPGHREVFVAGDLSRFERERGRPLPGMAPVALQQGRHVAQTILAEIAGRPRKPFVFVDKGQMATIGRSRAILERGRLHMSGFPAWLAWLVVHIYYLSGFQRRLIVLLHWAWAYLTYRRGARLIVDRDWRECGRK